MNREPSSKQYPKATALYIMRLVNRLLVDTDSGGIDFLEFLDDAEHPPGVYVSKAFDGLLPHGEAGIEAGNMLAWKPACDMKNGPHPRTAPLLPETFAAAELAAFMLYGPGEAIQQLLGPIGSLDETALLEVGGKQGKWERDAIRAAYEVAGQAQDVVGAPDFEADDYVNRDAWIKAMVRQLLEPTAPPPEQPAGIEPEPEQHQGEAEAVTQEPEPKPVPSTEQAASKEDQGDAGPEQTVGLTLPTTRTHRLKSRVSPLDAVIELAKQQAIDPRDYHCIWAVLVDIAESKCPPPPLCGYSSDGIQYKGGKYEESGIPDVFTKNALRMKMSRSAR